MNFIFIFIVLAIGFIIWQTRNMRIAKARRLSKEKKEKETLKAKESILEQREARK